MSDDLLTQVAKMISPGAFTQWFDGTGPDANPVRLARQNYQRAEARKIAYDVLKFAARIPKLAHALAEIEKDDWEKMGVPVRGNRDLERIVEEKFDAR